MKGLNRVFLAGVAAGTFAASVSAQVIRNNDHFPPDGGTFTSFFDIDPVIDFGSSPVKLRNLELAGGSGGLTLPPGSPYMVDSFFDIFVEISFDGGSNWFPSNSPGTRVVIGSNPTGQSGNTSFFDVEIVELRLETVAFNGCKMRESPTMASTGQAAITDIGGGMYHIDSFFDIWTELSLDGGQSWMPASGSQRIELVPEPGTVAALGLGMLALLRRRNLN